MNGISPEYLTDASGFSGFAEEVFVPSSEAAVFSPPTQAAHAAFATAAHAATSALCEWHSWTGPEQAAWLKDDEKNWLIGELHKEANQKSAGHRTSIADAFRSGQTLLLIGVFFLVVAGNQAILFFFLPLSKI